MPALGRGFLLISVIALVLASCTPQRMLVYMQGDPAMLSDTTRFVMMLYPGDIISMNLFTVNPEAFPGLTTGKENAPVMDNRSAYEKGYVIDSNGDVSFPYIGHVHLSGLTIEAAHDTLVGRFRQFIEDPVVILKKLSFKISIVGEVNKPGLYYIPNEQLTLMEAIALAGDLTNYSDRTNVKIMRKNGDRVEQIQVDLTQMESFIGRTRFIYPDDVIYVAPSKKKGFTSISPATAVITSSLTVLILAATLYLNTKD